MGLCSHNNAFMKLLSLSRLNVPLICQLRPYFSQSHLINKRQIGRFFCTYIYTYMSLSVREANEQFQLQQNLHFHQQKTFGTKCLKIYSMMNFCCMKNHYMVIFFHSFISRDGLHYAYYCCVHKSLTQVTFCICINGKKFVELRISFLWLYSFKYLVILIPIQNIS